MDSEKQLRDKLRKIEALFAGTMIDGEKSAAKDALQRIQNRLKDLEKSEKSMRVRFSMTDRWARQLFIALCRRYNLEPYRLPRQRETSIMLTAPKSFIEDVLWPEFQALNGALTTYVSGITERIIREEIHKNTKEVPEIPKIATIH